MDDVPVSWRWEILAVDMLCVGGLGVLLWFVFL